MQATVHRFDPETASGSVVTDDGAVVPFAAEVMAGSGLRHLRSGQRLTVELGSQGGAPRVVRIRLGTVGSVPRGPASRDHEERS